ncbi:reverse ribonuclease integrase, partial [Lasius niger]
MIEHDFSILTALESDVLIGVDLWARTNLSVSPPPRLAPADPAPTCGKIGGLAHPTASEQQRLEVFLAAELTEFEAVRGPTRKTTHHIRLRNDTPIKQRYRPRNPAMQAVIDREVAEMEAAGVIEPSKSAWSSPVVIVKKKDGKHRFCIDFRKVNDVTERDAYPLPQITATLDKLRGARYLTTLDLKNGYWQVPLAPESRPITAFTIPGRGLYQFTVMPFGLHSAPATFQRLLDQVLGPELEPNVFVYLDDIIVISETFDRHLHLLTEVFRRLREARLRLNPDKCRFCVERLKYLGHVIDREGIRTDPEKVSAVADWPEPRTVKQVRQFLGMASWYRRFVANFSTIAAPLTRLTKKNARWTWGTDEEGAFQELKRTLISAPVLACPDFTRRFVLQTDASNSGLGAVLTQNFEDGERVIAYASRTLNGAERNYSATELECLAVVWGIRRMKGYLEGYPFTVLTDHQS